MAGLIHIYCGDGKGKTTAAVGLAVRAAGAGKRVVFAQFFKDGSSSEVGMLRVLDNVRTMHCQTIPGRFKNMNEEQKAKARADYSKLLENVLAAGRNISSDISGQSGTRLVMCCMAMGEAAGITAALAASQGIRAAEVSYKEVQQHLLQNGAVLD